MTKTGDAARPTPAIEPESLTETWILYKKPILIGVIALAVVGGGVWMWRSTSAKKELRADQAYTAAEASYMAGNKALAVPELEKVATRYQGTTAGTQAAMLIAESQMEQGKNTEAVAQLEGVLSSAPGPMKSGLYALLGAAYEGSGKPKEAADAFGRAAAAAAFQADKDMQLIEQARNLVAAGDKPAGEKILPEIAGREDSPYAGEARVRLGEVTAKQ